MGAEYKPNEKREAVFLRTSNSKLPDHQGNSHVNGPTNYSSSYKWEDGNSLEVIDNYVLNLYFSSHGSD